MTTTERIKYRTLLRGLLLVMSGATLVHSQTVTTESKCFNDTGRPVCFIAERSRETRLRSWKSAMDYCQSLNGSTLPTVTSPLIQFHLTEFLVDNDFTLDSAWIGGRGVSSGTPNEWTWIDGSPFQGITAQSPPFLDTVASIAESLDVNGTTHGELLRHSLDTEIDGYICQYKDGRTCSGYPAGTFFSDGSSCFVRYDESISWFLARNKCLMRGGDLTKLTDTTDAGIKDMLDQFSHAAPTGNTNLAKQYWIGLRKIWWNWKLDNSEIKIAYVKDHLVIEDSNIAEQNCLAIDYKQQFAWGIRNCSIALQTICQAGDWTETPTTPTRGAKDTQTVSLPVWAVALICGLCGLFYIVSLIVVGIICCKCCGNKTSKKDKDNEGGRNRSNSYGDEPKGVDHRGPSSQETTAAYPTVNDDADDVEYVYPPDDEFDDAYEMPQDTNTTGRVYANSIQMGNPPGRGRPR